MGKHIRFLDAAAAAFSDAEDTTETRTMTRVCCALLILPLMMFAVPALAQGLVGDMLAGKLVDPEVGQWAWYEVRDAATENRYMLRQAIVGEEAVGRQTGYWVEFELAPEIGYTTLFRMLLTGPASNPRNVHRVYQKVGPNPAEMLPITDGDIERPSRPRRESQGLEYVETHAGFVEAEHYTVEQDGRELDLWMNERVYPSGIVRLLSDEGEMILRNFGKGGEYARSRIEEVPVENPYEGDEDYEMTPDELTDEEGPARPE